MKRKECVVRENILEPKSLEAGRVPCIAKPTSWAKQNKENYQGTFHACCRLIKIETTLALLSQSSWETWHSLSMMETSPHPVTCQKNPELDDSAS